MIDRVNIKPALRGGCLEHPMRIIRVAYANTSFYARLEDRQVICLDRSKGLNDPLPLDQVALLPLAVPTKIICLGMNYKAHAEELGRPMPEEPLIFLKAPSSVCRSGDAIIMPTDVGRVDFEGELALVMGRQGRHIPAEQAPEFVFGYTCANDVTARDLQNKDGLFARAKGFDTFCPVGPWIETEPPDIDNLAVTTMVNGETRQQGSTSDMAFSPAQIVSFISRIMTLMPGDIILTGTPPGIGPLQPGDEVAVDIEGIGRLINPVLEEQTGSGDAPGGPVQ